MKADEYVKRMMKTIHSHKEKEGIKREIQDCIEDLTEMYMEQGMTQEEAEMEAVRQMGDPYETAEMFNEVYQPKFEWRVAAYMALWIVIARAIHWALDLAFYTPESVIQNTLFGSVLIVFAVYWSYVEKSDDLPFLWWQQSPTRNWAMPGLGVFSNASSIAGLGIGIIAGNLQQIIVLYGMVTIVMLFQRLFVESEQNKLEQQYLYKECIALKDFDFEAYVKIEDRKYFVRIRKGQKARKGDNLIITGMIGFTFIVEKF